MVFPGFDVNWYQTPVLQDMKLFRQLWVDEHPSGARYRPLAAGALPNTDRLMSQTIVLPSWGAPVPRLVDQYAEAFHKVAERMEDLAEYQCAKSEGAT